MVNSKNGGKNVSVSDLSALRPPKPVTSSTLQLAKKSALASKTRMLANKPTDDKYVVKVSTEVPAGTVRKLSREELNSLRDTKKQVAQHMQLKFATAKK
jgi:enoyl-[acyl-carrier-protein] reductase (NADH)